MSYEMKTFHNGASFGRGEIPMPEGDSFFQGVLDAITRDGGSAPISAFRIPPERRCTASCQTGPGAAHSALFPQKSGRSFPSLATLCPQLQLFEREIAEQCLVRPEGHPWFKSVRFQKPLCDGWGSGTTAMAAA